MELLLPLLMVDAVLGWMVWRSWHGRELMGVRRGQADAPPSLYWLGFARLGGLFALALVGTVAACRAM